MARKNIFQLVEENYDIQFEIRKIAKLFEDENYFVKNSYARYTPKELVADYLFSDWKYRGTCISIDEYLERVDASISATRVVTEDQIINNLEVMENFIKLYFDNGDELCEEYGIKHYPTLVTVFCDLIKALEKRMGVICFVKASLFYSR